MLFRRTTRYAIDSPLDREEITRRLRTLLGLRRDAELAWQRFAPLGVLYAGEAGEAGWTIERHPDVGRRYLRFEGVYIPAPEGTRVAIETKVVGTPGSLYLMVAGGVVAPAILVLLMLARLLPGPRPAYWYGAAALLLFALLLVRAAHRRAARMLAEDRAAIDGLLTMTTEEAAVVIDRRRRESGALMRIREFDRPSARLSLDTPLQGEEIIRRLRLLCDGNRTFRWHASGELPQFEGIIGEGTFMLRHSTDDADSPFISGNWSRRRGISTLNASIYFDDPRDRDFIAGLIGIGIGAAIVIFFAGGGSGVAVVVAVMLALAKLIFFKGHPRFYFTYHPRHEWRLYMEEVERFLASVLDPDTPAPEPGAGRDGGDTGDPPDDPSGGPPDDPRPPDGTDIPDYESQLQSS